MIGGTASVLGGGKFANGAISGAFSQMLNGEQTLRKYAEILAVGGYSFMDSGLARTALYDMSEDEFLEMFPQFERLESVEIEYEKHSLFKAWGKITKEQWNEFAMEVYEESVSIFPAQKVSKTAKALYKTFSPFGEEAYKQNFNSINKEHIIFNMGRAYYAPDE